MKTLQNTFFALLGLTLSLTSCSSDDDATTQTPVNEEEVITTVKVVLTPQSISQALVPEKIEAKGTITLEYKDLDGEGPGKPVITEGTVLASNTTYTGVITFLNETENPTDDITVEIKEEADEHQVFYTASTGLNITTSYTDTDSKGNPLGLKFNLTTGANSTGTLTTVLKHEPTKPNTGLANAGGSTDAEVAFNVTIGNVGK